MNLSWGKYDVWLVGWWIPSLCVFLCLSDHNTLRVLMWLLSMFDYYIHLGHWYADDIDRLSCLSYHINSALTMIIMLTLMYMFTLLYILFVLVLIFLLVNYLNHLWACYPCCYSSWLSYSCLACAWTWMIYLCFAWLPIAWLFIFCVISCCLFVWVAYLSPYLQPSSFNHFLLFGSYIFKWGLVCICFSDRGSD